jgi:hypothetical protein
MELEVLHIEDCPNWQEAGARAARALAKRGHSDIPVTYRLLRTPDDAALTAFAGSPTLVLDGADLFPSDDRTADLACRVYVTPQGLAGLPTEDQIVDAIAKTPSASSPKSPSVPAD